MENSLVIMSDNDLQARSQHLESLRVMLSRTMRPNAFYKPPGSKDRTLTAAGARQMVALLGLQPKYGEPIRYTNEDGSQGYVITVEVYTPNGHMLGSAIADSNTRLAAEKATRPGRKLVERDLHIVLGLAQAYALRRALTGFAQAIGLTELMDYHNEEAGDVFPGAASVANGVAPAQNVVEEVQPEKPDWVTKENARRIKDYIEVTLKMNFEDWKEYGRKQGFTLHDFPTIEKYLARITQWAGETVYDVHGNVLEKVDETTQEQAAWEIL